MADIHAILNQRTKKSDSSSKMAAMARQSATGNLTSFAGIFSVTELSEAEKGTIKELLSNYAENEDLDIEQDLETLLSITTEVKAINNQAALLHGERIKKAHHLLTRYRDGAFTAWLIAAYGNRQTPYNLMQYYEFYESLPKPLRPQLESMPRQAVYTLASRTGSMEQKQEIVKNYQGESKLQMIELIRDSFPLVVSDKRQRSSGDMIIDSLQSMLKQLRTISHLNQRQKEKIQGLLNEIHQRLGIHSK